MLRPEVITATLAALARRLTPATVAARIAETDRSFKTVERELARLTQAIKAGGPLAPLVAEVQRGEARRDALRSARSGHRWEISR